MPRDVPRVEIEASIASLDGPLPADVWVALQALRLCVQRAQVEQDPAIAISPPCKNEECSRFTQSAYTNCVADSLAAEATRVLEVFLTRAVVVPAGEATESECVSWLYLPALVEGCLEADYSAGERCAPSKTTPTDKRCCSRAKRTASSILSRSGRTFEILTEPSGVESWISTLRASRASRIRPRLGAETMPTASSARLSGSWRTFALGTSSLRTYWRSPIQPNVASFWRASVPPSWVPVIAGLARGWLPTLTTKSNQQSPSMLKYPAYRRLAMLTRGKRAPVAFWEWMMGWVIGWTDLQPLGMDRFRQWLRLHGGCLLTTEN